MITRNAVCRSIRRNVKNVINACALPITVALNACTHLPDPDLSLTVSSSLLTEPGANALVTHPGSATAPAGIFVPALVIPETGKALKPGTVLVIRFEFNSNRLTEGSREGLDLLAEHLKNPDWAVKQISVHGHTDSVGDVVANFVLSCQRARVVTDYLRQRTSVPVQLFYTVGFGAQRPLVDNTTSQSRYINRRVEVKISL